MSSVSRFRVLGLATCVAMMCVSSTAFAAMGFLPPAALNTNAGSDSGSDRFPAIATDGLGRWIAVWNSTDTLGGTVGTDADIFVSRSLNNGTTWSAPVALNSNATSDSGQDLSPSIATDGAGNWVVVWHSTDTLGGTVDVDADIFVSRSSDNGASWSAVATLNNNATTDSGNDYNPNIATDRAGEWLVAWHSYTDLKGAALGTDADILVSASVNNGQTWSTPVPLNTNAATDSGQDYFPVLTSDGAGNWLAVWHSDDTLGNTLGADFDIFVSRSGSKGFTWTAPTALNVNAASDSGNDYWPTAATDGAGNWVVVWQSQDSLGNTVDTDYDVFVARSNDNGETWSAVEPLNSNADSDSGHDYEPAVATDGSGAWLAVWYSRDSLGDTVGLDEDIFVARSLDAGETWSAVQPISTNANADSGSDSNPKLAVDGSGRWIAVWFSNDALGGTAGADNDIFFATSGIASSPAALQLIAPNGGEKLKIGKRFKISWVSVGEIGANVKLELFRKGSLVAVIKGSTPNDGLHKWRVPNTVSPGKGYKVRITSTANNLITDQTDGKFRIKAP